MTKPEGPQPELSERLRMPLRIFVVIGGYALYRWVGDPMGAALMMWAGTIALGWAVIERFTTYRQQRMEMMLWAQGLLGIGLIVAATVTGFR
ncbi:MAG TPA: hypothetical protein VFK89_11770 [Actinomycetota bacterium]|nr:hypothetical protein [Actinomycetota bacterium]